MKTIIFSNDAREQVTKSRARAGGQAHCMSSAECRERTVCGIDGGGGSGSGGGGGGGGGAAADDDDDDDVRRRAWNRKRRRAGRMRARARTATHSRNVFVGLHARIHTNVTNS